MRLRSTWLIPILRKLLQMDRPVPQRTQEEVRAERDQNYRWNFAVNLTDVTSFWFGLSFISAATIVPLYISKLTDSPIPIGLAAVIARGGWFLPQLFTANFVERLPRKKPMIVNVGFFAERLPMWVIVLSAVIAAWNPTLALIVFFIGYAWHGFGAGVVATAWQDLIARCFPVNRRGRFLGIGFFLGALTGAIAAGISVQVLGGYTFPTNFLISFFVAAVAINISWLALAQTREPVESVTAPRQSTRQFWGELPRILRHDKNYSHFLVARLLLALSGMGIGFVTVAAISRWAIADSTVGLYTAAFLIGQTIGNLILGFVADKVGHKLPLEIAAIGTALAFLVAWFAQLPDLYFLVFILLGLVEGATIVSGMAIVMEFSTPEKRPTYAGLSNTSVGVVSMIGPMIGAVLALLGYNWLFFTSVVISILAFIAFRWWVKEPRFSRPVQEPGD